MTNSSRGPSPLPGWGQLLEVPDLRACFGLSGTSPHPEAAWSPRATVILLAYKRCSCHCRDSSVSGALRQGQGTVNDQTWCFSLCPRAWWPCTGPGAAGCPVQVCCRAAVPSSALPCGRVGPSRCSCTHGVPWALAAGCLSWALLDGAANQAAWHL